MDVPSDAKNRALTRLAAALLGLALAMVLGPLHAAPLASGASPQAAEVQGLLGGLGPRCECPAVTEHAQPAVSQAAKQMHSGEAAAAAGVARPDAGFVSRFSYRAAFPVDAPARSLPLYLLSSRLRR